MATYDSKGELLTIFGYICKKCIAKKETKGELTEGVRQKFREADKAVSQVASALWSWFVNDPPPIKSTEIPITLLMKEGKAIGVRAPVNSKGKNSTPRHSCC
jgi:hypothetical protein